MTQTAPSAAPRRRRVLWIVVILAVAAAVTLPTWGWRSAVASGDVRVVPGPMTCDGKLVRMAVSGDDEPLPTYVIPIEKGMSCQVIVTVANHSGRTVRVRDMAFPGLMPGHDNGGPMIITGNDSSQKPRFGGGLTAVFDVDESVSAGESTEIDLRLNANPDACNSKGTARLQDLPTTRIDVLHREHTVQGRLAIAVQIETALRGPDCTSSS